MTDSLQEMCPYNILVVSGSFFVFVCNSYLPRPIDSKALVGKVSPVAKRESAYCELLNNVVNSLCCKIFRGAYVGEERPRNGLL